MLWGSPEVSEPWAWEAGSCGCALPRQSFPGVMVPLDSRVEWRAGTWEVVEAGCWTN